jgi:hypothetical protein
MSLKIMEKKFTTKRQALHLILMAIFTLGIAANSQATPINYYVSPTGNDNNNGISLGNAFATILKASQVAVPGDTINVANGTYAGYFKTTTSGSSALRLTYRSINRHMAKIVGSGRSNVWLNTGNYCNFDGFEITGPTNRGGILSGPWTTGDTNGDFCNITNNFIHDISNGICNSSGGIHVFGPGGGHNIIGNIVRNIDAAQIGSCSTTQGIYISSPDCVVKNNIVSGVAAVGIQQWHGATRSTIVNNTVFNCKIGILIGQGDSGRSPQGTCGNFVENNISMNNQTYGIHGISGVKCGGNTYKNNILYGNGTGILVNETDVVSENLTSNPLLVNYQADGSGDYHLQSTSPAINSGISIHAPATDFDGVTRKGNPGIGAYYH